MIEQTATTMNLDNSIMAMQGNAKQQIGMFTFEQVQQLLAQAIQANSKPTYEGDTILFTDFAEQWFSSRKNVGQGTYAKNRINYDTHIKPYLTGKMLTQVDVKTVQSLLDSLNLKPATIKLVKSVLNMIFKWADGQDLIRKNPMPFVTIAKGESYHKRSLTSEEIERLLNATDKERLWILPYLFLGTSMRREEVLGLKWDYVDFDKNQIYINEVFTQDGYSHTFAGEPKTKKSKHYVAIDDKLTKLLKQFKEEQTKKYGERVFVISQRKEDKQTTPSTTNDIMKRWRKKSGISDLTSHVFRHTYATFANEAGVPLLTIARQLGHTTTKLLETVYIHQTTTQDQQDCAKVVSNAMFKGIKKDTMQKA